MLDLSKLLHIKPLFDLKQISKKESINQLYKSKGDILNIIKYKLKYTNLKNFKNKYKMVQKNILATILINNYNNEKYLKKCITSCLGQTYKNLEIIVYDDKSNDNSKKILNKIKNRKIKKYLIIKRSIYPLHSINLRQFENLLLKLKVKLFFY